MEQRTCLLVVKLKIGLELNMNLVKHPSLQLTGCEEDADFTQLECWGKVEIFVSSGLSGDTVRFILANNPVKWMHSLYAGVENILIPELVESDIPLTCSRGICNEGLNDFTISSILYFQKHIPQLEAKKNSKIWEFHFFPKVKGKKILILGYGTIGVDIARTAKLGHGMEVIAMKRTVKGSIEYADEIYTISDLPNVLPFIDFLVICTPATPETYNIIGEAEIRMMKHTAIIVNVGRGHCLDELALSEALHEGRLLGAALDVFKEEPLPPDHFLWNTPRLLISPHSACLTEDMLENRSFENEVESYLLGAPFINLVNKDAGC